VSYKGIVQTLQTLYSISISEGTVDSLLKKASKLSTDEIDKIISQLSVAVKVGIFQTTL